MPDLMPKDLPASRNIGASPLLYTNKFIVNLFYPPRQLSIFAPLSV